MRYERALTDRQKRKVIKKLLKLWRRYPYLRLGQLIANVLGNNDLYFVEDGQLVERLKCTYEEKESK